MALGEMINIKATCLFAACVLFLAGASFLLKGTYTINAQVLLFQLLYVLLARATKVAFVVVETKGKTFLETEMLSTFAVVRHHSLLACFIIILQLRVDLRIDDVV